VSQQTFDPPQFAAPHEIFSPPQFANSIEDSAVVFAPAHHESPLATRLVLEDLPTTHESSFVAPSPILEPSRAVTPRQVPEPHSLLAPSPLGSSQAVTHQAATIPTVTQPLAIIEPPKTISPQQTNPSQEFALQHEITGPLPQVIQGPQAAVVYPSPNLMEDITNDSLGLTAVPTSAYKLWHTPTAAPPIQTRRDSIEGVPDIALFLSPSGYQFSPQDDPLVSPAESILTVPSTPSTTPSPDELVIPLPQQSLEEYMATPMETLMSIPTTPFIDDPNAPPSIEEHSAITVGLEADTVPNCFRFAPRVIPDYHIDRSDFPSWLLERGRLDFVLSVEAGDIWKKLITTWLRQERRVGFGLNEKLVS